MTLPAGSVPFNTQLNVTVRALDSKNTTSAPSAPVATLSAPANPTVTQVSYASGNMTVETTAVKGAVSYVVEAFKLDGTKVASATSSKTQVTLLPGSVPANTPLKILVRAVDLQNSTSAASPPVAAVSAPAAPTGVSGLGGKNKVTISWQPVAGAASYRVTLSNGMSFVTSSTSYTVTGLETATSYNCIVWAANSAGAQGPGSAPVAVRTANIAPLDF